jgi:hypothetical protein
MMMMIFLYSPFVLQRVGFVSRKYKFDIKKATSDARHLGGGSLHFTGRASGNGIDICFIISIASHRLRPVMMTATVAVPGLLPASLSRGIAAVAQQRQRG